MFREFKDFALRGNVLDMAVGIIIGAAFNSVVRSLVDDIVMPPIGLLLGRVDFTNLFISLSGQQFGSLAKAQEAGAATLNYGLFINSTISFVIVAYVVFLLMKWFTHFKERADELDILQEKDKEAAAPSHKDCPFCFTSISVKATRCPQCTSQLATA